MAAAICRAVSASGTSAPMGVGQLPAKAGIDSESGNAASRTRISMTPLSYGRTPAQSVLQTDRDIVAIAGEPLEHLEGPGRRQPGPRSRKSVTDQYFTLSENNADRP